jgi:hypothetical protein
MRVPQRQESVPHTMTSRLTLIKFFCFSAIWTGIQAFAWISYSRTTARTLSLAMFMSVALAVAAFGLGLGIRRGMAAVVGVPILGTWPFILFAWRMCSLPNRYWEGSVVPARWQGRHTLLALLGAISFAVEALMAL